MKVNILHLYYDIMNLYGEYGNISILKKHLTDQGANVKVDTLSINDKIDFSKYNLIYIGEGSERSEMACLDHLINYKDELNEYIENYGFMLLTGNSYEMLGKSIDGKEAINTFSFTTNFIKSRNVSDAIYESEYVKDDLVGFINNMSNVEGNIYPLAKVKFGLGENISNKSDGIKYKNIYGTHLIGPFLVKNPSFLKYFIKELLTSIDSEFVYKDIAYKEEEESYKITLSELNKRKDSQ